MTFVVKHVLMVMSAADRVNVIEYGSMFQCSWRRLVPSQMGSRENVHIAFETNKTDGRADRTDQQYRINESKRRPAMLVDCAASSVEK